MRLHLTTRQLPVALVAFLDADTADASASAGETSRLPAIAHAAVVGHAPTIARAAVFALLLSSVVAGCGSSGKEENGCIVDSSYNPAIHPGAFVAAVDNPLYPLTPGARFTYAAGMETVEVVVLADRRTILGVSCTIVHDVARVGHEVIEDTYDWFAQDSSGTVWYFGEDTKEMSGGVVVSTEGSWEAGVDGAKAGVIIPGDPAVGQTYRQEYYACEAEDMGEIVDLDATADVPFGSFTGCMKTRDFTPLDLEVNENKYYKPGVGLVLSVDVTTGDREELIDAR